MSILDKFIIKNLQSNQVNGNDAESVLKGMNL